MTTRTALLLAALAAAVGLACLAAIPLPVHASSRWTPAVAERLAEAWPDVEAAAEIAGVPAVTLGAQAVTETSVLPLEGWYEPVLGVLQVRPATWRLLLWGAGYDDADLMDPIWGWYAAAEVMVYLRAQYDRDGALLLCLWSDGIAALRYREDCLYSRAVARHERHVRGLP